MQSYGRDPADGAEDAAPSKPELASWWKQFKKNTKKKEEQRPAPAPTNTGIFGVPLQTSIRYANVAISLFDAEGRSFTYGYVPIVVAKCGVFLKEKATEIEGIFRLAGAERRIKELQTIFNSPERYGKGLDWTGYTVHDAANILRRYLRELPEPIIPLEFYQRFREPLKNHQAQAVGEMDHQEPSTGEFDSPAAIRTYQQLITELPPLNRQLLLYILDLLAVFASKSDINRMTAPNLSAIFQPGLLSHPEHDMAPSEYRLSQDVLIFLIEHQDHFLVGMEGTAADEKTIQSLQSAAADRQTQASATPTAGSRSSAKLGRSASNASAGAESVRRFGGIRRNVSVSSRRSRASGNTPSPGTPPPDSPYSTSSKTVGIHRSNTVPSKKSSSPSVTQTRFPRDKVTTQVTSVAITQDVISTPQGIVVPKRESSQDATQGKRNASGASAHSSHAQPAERISPHLRPVPNRRTPSADRLLRMDLPSNTIGPVSPLGTPTREQRKPNKLQKRRPQGGANARESNTDLSGASHPSSPTFPHEFGQDGFSTPLEEIPVADLGSERPAPTHEASQNTIRAERSPHRPIANLKDMPNRASGTTIKPPVTKSPTGSVHSREGYSSHDTAEESETPEHRGERRHRWRLSTAGKKDREARAGQGQTLTAPNLGSTTGAERSTSTVGSSGLGRKSMTDETWQGLGNGRETMQSNESDGNGEKKGPLGWFKGKLQERKERTKSPPPTGRLEQGPSLNALSESLQQGPEKEAETMVPQPGETKEPGAVAE